VHIEGMNYKTHILSMLAGKGYEGARAITLWQSIKPQHATKLERSQFDNTLARLIRSNVLESSIGLNDGGTECRFYNIK
jgi:hypothetical protein